MVGFDLLKTEFIEPVNSSSAGPIDLLDGDATNDLLNANVDEIDPDFQAALQELDDFLEEPVSMFP